MQLYFYKRGQGYFTRLWSGIALWAITAIGCFVLHKKLAGFNEWVNTAVPVVLLALLTYFIYWLQNRPSLADFMILSEGELKKVSWSSKAEIVASTTVVIFVVVFMSICLGLVDYLFHYGFDKIGLYS